MTGSPTNQIRLDPASRSWRRRLGPLAWAVLEELALTARLTEQGWAAPVGVRAIGTAVGVTKDTAARAINTVSKAGLLSAERVPGPDGRTRSGYHLHLPDGITIRTCPVDDDARLDQHTPSVRPDGEYTHRLDGEYSDGVCPDGEDSARDRYSMNGSGQTLTSAASSARSAKTHIRQRTRPDLTSQQQGSFFDPPGGDTN